MAGPLLDVGPHIVGVAEYLAGPVTSVEAEAGAEEGQVQLVFGHSSGCLTRADVDLLAPVASTEETLSLLGPTGAESYANPEVVDFVGAYRAMLDELLGRVTDGLPASPRGLASSVDRAVAMAAVLDEAAARLASAR